VTEGENGMGPTGRVLRQPIETGLIDSLNEYQVTKMPDNT
jgi:hypothetical protein